MSDTFSIFPKQASVQAIRTDLNFFLLLGFSCGISLLVLCLVVGFAARYRQGSTAKRGEMAERRKKEIEIGWTSATFFFALFFFWWASATLLRQLPPPNNALEIHVVAKQWMWKVQHPTGAREINTLHAPEGVPVKLVMTSQDVIHSFYVPEFRMKQDVLPGRYTQTWFQARYPGVFHLECAEYCGTDHARMGGTIVVLSQADYAKWAAAQPESIGLAREGAALYVSLGCSRCHEGTSAVSAPSLRGIWGKPVLVASGGTRMVDETWLREAIMTPDAARVAGFPPEMPGYQGVISEDDLVRLIAYLKALGQNREAQS
jgi:cytochrome c oxidase subunit II